MPHIISSEVGVVVTKTLTLLFGGLITYYAWRAHQRTGAPELRALSIGFGIVTLGALLGGVLDLVVSRLLGEVDLVVSVFVASALTTVGFAVILYSLYVE
ncbi:MAG: hypothetical protein ABEJ89_03040 [Haloarculaceae archaeon]